MELGEAEGKANQSKVDKYKTDQANIAAIAKEHEQESEVHSEKHRQLSRAVTFFQIAIAISAIAILTRRKRLWYGSLLLASGGIVFFIMGLL